jgi:small subunit ribosomal protein S4
LQLLERRLDNVIYRGGFSTSRRGARQLVSHGHFQLNGKAINVPSARVNAGDVITLKPSSKKNTYFSQFDPKTGGEQPALSWLKANPKKFEITINGLPTREEAEANINEQLIVEYYSR